MKVVFLDFDGVLNTDSYIRSCGYDGLILDPSKMRLLKKIIESTDAKIVLTTSWKEHWEKDSTKCDASGKLMNTVFARYGLEIFDKIPHMKEREDGIANWLDANPEAKNYVILDDFALEGNMISGHLVRTSAFRDGLEDEHMRQAIQILNK